MLGFSADSFVTLARSIVNNEFVIDINIKSKLCYVLPEDEDAYQLNYIVFMLLSLVLIYNDCGCLFL